MFMEVQSTVETLGAWAWFEVHLALKHLLGTWEKVMGLHLKVIQILY